MSDTSKSLSFNVFARAQAAGFGVVARDVERVHGGLGKLASIAGGLFAADKLVGFFKESTAAARESQKANAQTAAVIKSTGDASHVTAKQVAELGDKISLKTGIDHEQIQSSENMLLTFTNIRNELGKGNDVFSQATQVVTDMSVALGQDSTKSAIQLGKALNDPIHGVTALQRVGVTFDAQQKKQIKTMVASGHTLDAQKLILRELTKEFGGSAAAQATAGDKAKVAWKDFQQQIGAIILPLLDKLENALSQKVLPAFSRVVTWVQAHWPQIQKVIQAAWNNVIHPVLLALVTFIRDRVIPIIQTVVRWVVTHWPQIQAAVKAVWANVRPLLIQFRDLINQLWHQVLQPFVEWFKRNWPVLSTVAKVVFGGMIVSAKVVTIYFRTMFALWAFQIRATATTFGALDRAWRNTYQFIVRNGAAIVDWFRHLPGRIMTVFSGAGNWLTGVGRSVIRGLWTGISALGKWIIDKIKSVIPGWIRTALGIHSPPAWAVDAGHWIAKGLAYGITHRFPHLIGNLAKMAKDKLASAVTIGGGINADKLAEEAYAKSLFSAHGWDVGREFGALQSLWQGESGWNAKALNPSSGAFGIPQALPASKMDAYGDRTKPAVQIRWGEDYIKATYGSPSAAFSKWLARSPHWYGAGLPPTLFTRPTLIGVGERGPETVSVTRGRGSPGGVNYITIQVNGGDPRAVVRALEQWAGTGGKIHISRSLA